MENEYNTQQKEVAKYWINIIKCGNGENANSEKSTASDTPIQSELDGAPAILAMIPD